MQVRVIRDWYGPVGDPAGPHQFFEAGQVIDWPDGFALIRHVEPLEGSAPPKPVAKRRKADAAPDDGEI